MSFEPSANFLSKFVQSAQARRIVEQAKKHFDVFSYFAEKVPKRFSDDDWKQMLQHRTAQERASFWTYLAVRHQREEADILKKEKIREEQTNRTNEERKKYEAGGMGYGTSFYRSHVNPFKNERNYDNTIFSRVLPAYTTNEYPTILLDTQYVNNARRRESSRLGAQVEMIIHSYLYGLRQPLPLELINLDTSTESGANFYRHLGYLRRSDSRIKSLLPEVHSNNPYREQMSLRSDCPEEEQIVYISRHSSNVLDGPLRHKGYVIPISWDREKESLGVCRSNRFRVMALPVDKYVKWQSGGKAIPFLNIYKIFATLTSNGCNWEHALRTNIAAHHFVPMDELLKKASHHELKHRADKQNMRRLVQLMEEAVRQ